MADTSGSFDTNVVGSFYLTFYWERTGTGDGTTTINYNVTAHNTPRSL